MQGNVRKKLNKQLFVGWSEAKVCLINPTQEELDKFGVTLEEEPEYIGENDEGIETARIDFWMEDVKNGYKYKKSFFLENINAENKPKEGEEEGFKRKTQYINQVGDILWAETKKDLSEKFTKFRTKVKGSSDEYEIYGDKVSRIAKKGEGDLMDFVKKWTSECDFYDVDTNILLDMKRIFAGNFNELKQEINGKYTLVVDKEGNEHPSTMVNVLEVKVVDGEDGPKEYQNVWRRSVAGWQMKSIRNTKFTEDNIAKWIKEGKGKNNPNGVRWLKNYEKLAIEISTGEWKSKNFYKLEPINEYNPEENFVASNKAVTKEAISEENDDY
jgi:hypothetical protein